MLSALHHAAGLWHSYVPPHPSGVLYAIVSLARVVLAATGLWIWRVRCQERTIGVAWVVANVAFKVTVLVLLHRDGPVCGMAASKSVESSDMGALPAKESQSSRMAFSAV